MTFLAEPRASESAPSHVAPEPPRGARMQLWSVFVASGATTFAGLLVLSGRLWMSPLAAALLYLTYRSYSIYRDQLAADRCHHQQVTRLHRDAVAALETAQLSEQRYA